MLMSNYKRPQGISFRDVIEAKLYALYGVEDENMVIEYLHFSLLRKWRLI
jgi:hypothetical protein